MPRHADPDQRRRQIAEAVWRLGARGGLEQVTLRQVAAEAGVSARLLQYYFGNRQHLLVGALEIFNADAEQQARDRITALEKASLRAIVRAVLLELLPLDDARRARHLIYAVYFVRFLTDPDLKEIGAAGHPALQELVIELLLQAVEAGEAPSLLDAKPAAAVLVAVAQGLQAEVLLGQTSAECATAIIDYQLDAVFGGQ